MTVRWAGPYTTAPCTGADGAGAATYTTPHKLNGLVHSIVVKYAGDKPATTDVTVKTRGTSPAAPTFNLLVVANSATDGMYNPRLDAHKASDGTALTANNVLPLIDDYVQVVVAQANTDDTVTIWLGLVD